MKNFYVPNLTDNRIFYAKKELETLGYKCVNNSDNADFLLISPLDTDNKDNSKTIKYFTDEEYLLSNAYLTAEIAVAMAVINSKNSLINSNVLIIGYGRIGKALARYISAFTNNITVCARNEVSRAVAKCEGLIAVDFESLTESNDYDYVFNTVPFPVMAEKQLQTIKPDCTIVELASLPGGIDKHVANLLELTLIEARGLPAKFSPKSAGLIVANAVDKIIREGKV